MHAMLEEKNDTRHHSRNTVPTVLGQCFQHLFGQYETTVHLVNSSVMS